MFNLTAMYIMFCYVSHLGRPITSLAHIKRSPVWACQIGKVNPPHEIASIIAVGRDVQYGCRSLDSVSRIE